MCLSYVVFRFVWRVALFVVLCLDCFVLFGVVFWLCCCVVLFGLVWFGLVWFGVFCVLFCDVCCCVGVGVCCCGAVSRVCVLRWFVF